MRDGQGRGADRGSELSVPDEVLRPALEATIEVVRAAASTRVPVPGPLRPLLKLRTLPDRALGTVRRVVEQDERLRTIVGAATTEELVGRASWLWLQRPEGWEADLEAEAASVMASSAAAAEARESSTAVRRLAAVEESLRKVEASEAALRSELAALKDELAEERKARRAADTEAGRLRRQLADAAAPPVEDRAALMAEVIRLEAALASTPPSDVNRPDPAPVRRALEALDRVRDELGDWLTDSPPSGAPAAEARRRPTPLPPAVFADTVQAAEHLVRVPGVVVLVDGYNVTKLRFPALALPDQRAWLLDAAGALAARSDAELHVVFDGADPDRGSAPADGPRRASVHVRFTGAGIEADDEVLALARAVPVHRPVVVVSDDRRVQDGAVGLGANVVGSGTFADLLRR